MANHPLTFAESLRLRAIDTDVFRNIYEPWTWPDSIVIPGGLLMSQCAVAASHTVGKDFYISSLHANFLAGASAKKPLNYRVSRLSDGGRFVVRSVTIEQGGRNMLHATVSFVRDSPWTGTSMSHSTKRRTKHHISAITMDDLETGRGPLGSFMRFQRLPLVFNDTADLRDIPNGLTSCAGQIIPPIEGKDDTITTHLLGLINLSDYHILDTPLQLYGLTFGLPVLGDKDGRTTERQTKLATTLSHSIHFHRMTGWRADDLTYIEANTNGAGDGKATVRSEIYDKYGKIIATCMQESFFVFKKGVKL